MDKKASGKLYVVATPIGNLGDLSFRAIEILKHVDIIASEDTRHTLILLKKFDIHTKLLSYHKFNEQASGTNLLQKLIDGQNIALVTDAGTPCVSDPGAILVDLARQNDIEVLAVPGASAAIAALSISGFYFDGFEFLGFFPRQSNKQQQILDALKASVNQAFIFYESPNRIVDMLKTIEKSLGNIIVLVCNDLTKLHERSMRGKISHVLTALENDAKSNLGEYVVIINKTDKEEPPQEQSLSLEAVLVDYMIKNNCTVKEAITSLSKSYNKNLLYKASLDLKSLFTLIKQ